MIRAFEGIAEKGLGEPTIVAAGISEALITTATGLVIAVPALAVYTYFATRADAKGIQFEAYGHGFVDALLRRWRASQAACFSSTARRLSPTALSALPSLPCISANSCSASLRRCSA